MRALAILALLAGALLAGCNSPSSDAPSDTEPSFDDLGLQATSSTGIIRGIVVDEAIRPIEGAKIRLQGEAPAETVSTEAGTFGFQGLPAGTYFLAISKPGYFPAQQSTEVVAGVPEPAIVKVQLAFDAANQPFVETFVYEGFIECTTSVLVLCGAPNLLTDDNVTNDRFTWDQYFSDGAELLQAELVWDSTQALSPQLYFEMEALADGCDVGDDTFLGSAEGDSPVLARLDKETIEEADLGQTCPVYFSLFAGDATSGAAPVGLGATVQQRFTMYIHAFHGYLPPEEWRFSSGEPVPEPQG